MEKYWSEYWDNGSLTSFSDKSGNYVGPLERVWKAFFYSQTEAKKVLDLGTGNGALLELASSICKDSILMGVDYADIKTQKLPNKSYEIIGKTNIEKLPFKASSFDVIVSQFAIEYSDMSSAINECARVLKSGATFQFICHHYDSIILKENINILTCLHEIPCLLLHLYNFKVKGDFKAHDKVLEHGRSLQAQFGSGFAGTDFINFYHYVKSLNDKAQLEKSFDLYKRNLESHKARLTALQNAALTPQRLSYLQDVLLQNFTSVDVELLSSNLNKTIAYKIYGTK